MGLERRQTQGGPRETGARSGSSHGWTAQTGADQAIRCGVTSGTGASGAVIGWVRIWQT
jgi:hypothetical protein